MTPETWQRAASLFEHIHALAPPEQQRVLAQVDAELGNLVVSWLASDAAARREQFLDTPLPSALAAAASGPPPLGLQARIGPYRLEHHLGGGGMGDVFRAVRVDDYHQVVAIKLIRHGFDSAEMSARFIRERQILAALDHPHITRLLDGGADSQGRPYLVMEFVDGSPLRWEKPATSVDLADRLRLLIDICRAVQFAHEKGIIHRDLKPDNVMLTTSGIPKMMDFGLARSCRDSFQLPTPGTESRGLWGTPSYMAPEQLRGPDSTVGPWTDIHALGGLLFTLLTGEPPFVGQSIADTLDQVATQEPTRPSSRNPLVTADLDTICQKCLNKEPHRRYPSAQDIADELTRVLHGEPVRARPVGYPEKFRRWCRRSPKLASLAAALTLAILAGFSGVTMMWYSARCERQEAVRQHDRAQEQQQFARQAIDDIVQVAERWLSHQPNSTREQTDLLERALTYYRGLARQEPADDAIRIKTAQLCHFVGRHLMRQGRWKEAEQHFMEQLERLDALVAESPQSPSYRFEMFHARRELAEVVQLLGRADESAALHGEALASIRDLSILVPDEPNYRDALAHQFGNVGRRQAANGQLTEAIRSFRDGLAVSEQLLREFPNRQHEPFFENNLVFLREQLGGTYLRMRRPADAEAVWRQRLDDALHLEERQAGNAHRGAVVVTAAFDLADLLARQNRFEEAIRLTTTALDRCTTLAVSFPQQWDYRVTRVSIARRLAQILWDAHRTQDADRQFREALALAKSLVADFPFVERSRTELAELLRTCPIVSLRNDGSLDRQNVRTSR